MKHILTLSLFAALACAQTSVIRETTAPTGNPSPGYGVCWFDTVTHQRQCRNSAGVVTTVQPSLPFTSDGTNVALPSGTLSVGKALPAGSVNAVSAANLVAVTPEQFGAVGNGVTDDVAAFFAMARALRLAGGGTVTLSPGKTYIYSNNRWSRSVPYLRIIGNGAALKCINAGGSYDQDAQDFIGNAAMSFDLDNETTGQSDQMHQADYISTVAVGSSTVTLSTTANAVNYPAGTPVFLSGYSQQTPTFPANPRYFEWSTVLSTNTGTGVITLTKPLVNAYRSDWIMDYVISPITYGPASILPLTRPKFVMGQSLYIEDVTFLENPNAPSYLRGNEGLGSVQIAGYMNAILNRVRIGYLAYGDCQNAEFKNSYAVKMEIDKETDTYLVEGSKFTTVTQATGFNNVVFDDSTVDGYFGIAPRHLKVTNTKIGCNAACAGAFGAVVGGPGGSNLSTPTLSSVYDNVTFVQPSGSILPLVNNGPPQTVTVATTDNSTYITVTGQTTSSILEFMEGRPLTGGLGGSGVITTISWSGSTVTFTGTFTAQVGEVFTVRPVGTLVISAPTTTGNPALVYSTTRQDNLFSLNSGNVNLTTIGSVPYASAVGVLQQDNANFFWDSVNHRLGIGTASPSKALDVVTVARLRGGAEVYNGASISNANAAGGFTFNSDGTIKFAPASGSAGFVFGPGFHQQIATSTSPACSVAGDIGKFWFDNTTTTTVFKVCMAVAGTSSWVVK